jgi:hypothetical protein
MLLLAFSCRFNAQNLLSEHTNNNNYFFDRKEKKKKRKKKKDMQVKSNAVAAVKVFWKNTTLSVAEVWSFFQKPGRLDLYCR